MFFCCNSMCCQCLQTFKHTTRRVAKLQSELAAALKQAEELGFDIDPTAVFQLEEKGKQWAPWGSPQQSMLACL